MFGWCPRNHHVLLIAPSLLVLVVLGTSNIPSVLAWSSSSTAPQLYSTTTTRYSSITSHLKSGLRTSDEEDNSRSLAPSRRQWLFGVANSVSSLLLLPPSGTAASAAGSALVVSTLATCDPTVSVWQRQGRLVYLLGTAHISTVSADLAGQLVKDVHPNAVFIELDLKRVGGLKTAPPALPISSNSVVTQDGATSKILVPTISGAPKVTVTAPTAATSSTTSGSRLMEDDNITPNSRGSFQSNALGFGAKFLGGAIRGMYKNLDKAGFRPGQEFISAVQEGQAIGSDIVLGDRDVDVTMRRLTQALAVTDLNRLLDPENELEQNLRELLPGGGEPPSLSSGGDDPAGYKEELSTFVESIKSRENVRKIMAQLKELAPALVQVMLEERDAFMAAGLDTLNQYTVIVAVMGIAHQDGVEQNLLQLGWKQARPRCKK